ncbi:MAG: SDR family NAD(P)-dependent oxidoreductase, partial [Candidatus Acidiferrales bacterium]
MSQLLAGKHALVTGGARGIGAAITRVLLAHGARVTMLGRSVAAPTDADLDIAKIRELNYISADVSDSDAVKQAFEASRSRFGKIEILVNNAGQASSAPFLKTDIALWRRMMSINLDGTFHCGQSGLTAVEG